MSTGISRRILVAAVARLMIWGPASAHNTRGDRTMKRLATRRHQLLWTSTFVPALLLLTASADAQSLASSATPTTIDVPDALSTTPKGINAQREIVGFFTAADRTVHG